MRKIEINKMYKSCTPCGKWSVTKVRHVVNNMAAMHVITAVSHKIISNFTQHSDIK